MHFLHLTFLYCVLVVSTANPAFELSLSPSGFNMAVTKDVEPFTIVGGVPAKIIGERKNKNPNYKLGRARLFQ